MVVPFGEQPGVVDPHVMELRHIEHVIALEAVGIDDAVRLYLLADDRNKRVRTGVWHDDNIDLVGSLEQPEHRNFTSRAAPAIAFAMTAEIAFVNLYPARHQLGCLGIQCLENNLAQLVVKQDRGVAIDACDLCRRTGCYTAEEILDQFFLNTLPKAATAPVPNHMKYIAFICYLCQPLNQLFASCLITVFDGAAMTCRGAMFPQRPPCLLASALHEC